MKKSISVILTAVMLLNLLAGCSLTLPTKEAGAAETQSIAAEITEPEGTSAPEESSAATASVPEQSTAETQPPETQVPATQPPETQPPETQPPESSAVPESSQVPETSAPEDVTDLPALEAYEKAVAQLPADYHVSLSLEISRTIDKDCLLTVDEWIMDVQGAGTEAMTASVQWHRNIENNKTNYDTLEYEIYYSKGKAVLIHDGRYYLAEQDSEAFLNDFPPLALLHADNYKSIEWIDEAHSGIRFLEAADTEWEWLGMDCSDITEAQGLVSLGSDGKIYGFEYEAEYALEGIAFTANAEMMLSELTQAPTLPQINSRNMVQLDSLRIVPIMELASCYADMEDFSINTISYDFSQAAGGIVLWQEIMALDTDEVGPMIYDQGYQAIYSASGTESSSYELRHFNGKTTYTEDDEEAEITEAPEDWVDYILDYARTSCFLPEDIKNASLSDEEDCWLIAFSATDDIADYIRGLSESELLGDADYFSDMGVSFKPDSCEGYLSVDKGSGLPIHLQITLLGNYSYQRQPYSLEYTREWMFTVSDRDVWHTITEEVRPSEALQEPAAPLFYQVTAENGHTLWLLGTIHVGDERTAHLPQEIYDALLSSDALAVEIDITDMEDRLDEDDELMQAYQKSTFYTDGSNAYDHLEEDVAEKLETAIRKYGGYIYLNYLSYNVSTLSSLMEQLFLGNSHMLSYECGVDKQLIKLAKDSGIEVWDVEDYAEHISLLSDFSEELQALILEETLDNGRYASNMGAKELFEAWCRGSEAELRGELDEEEEEDEELTPEEQALVDEYNEGMMRKRNAEMVEKAKEYLDSDKTVFFAVGLAHLLDEENGLLKCLLEEGYTVERVVFAGH